MAALGADREEQLPEPKVRPFNLRRDLDSVLDFQREVYEVNFPGFRMDRDFREDYARDLRRALRDPNEVMYVLEQGGRVCGFIWATVMSTLVDTRVGYIKNVYLAPELRGTGQAERMMSAVEQWLFDMGADKIMLDASLCNQRAVQFYERCGYASERVRMVKHLLAEQELD